MSAPPSNKGLKLTAARGKLGARPQLNPVFCGRGIK